MLASNMSRKILAVFVLLSGISLADIVNISPTSIDFGAQPIGAATSRIVTLANPTKKLLTISSITVAGDFASTSDTCNGNLSPGQQCAITITFQPTALGIRTAILSVNDDANNTPQKVKLTGSGSPAIIQSISISPFSATLKRGQAQQFTALGRYTDGTTQDITALATWSTNAPSVATVSTTGFVAAIGAGGAMINAAYASVAANSAVTVPVPVLTGMVVLPTSQFGSPGVPQQFTATALYDNGLSKEDATNWANWQTSDPTNCQIGATGLATCSLLENVSVFVIPPAPVSTNFRGTLNVAIQELFHGLNNARYSHTATYFSFTGVLIAGGGSDAAPNGQASAEIYNPLDGSFTTTGSMAVPRVGHTATLLGIQGTPVLIAGGDVSGTAELYDPASGTFSSAGALSVPRQGHTTTEFGSGFLLAGGNTATAEIYDQYTGVFTPTGSMTVARQNHTGTWISNGRVLIAGGTSASGILASAEVFDSAAGTFSPVASMAHARTNHTALRLNDGRVFIAGGTDGTASLSSTEIFDPATNTFSPGPSMSVARAFHTATLLPDGTVFIAGGINQSSSSLTSAEIIDISSGRIFSTGNLATANSTGARFAHTATLLGKQVLITGGYPGSAATKIAELYIMPF